MFAITVCTCKYSKNLKSSKSEAFFGLEHLKSGTLNLNSEYGLFRDLTVSMVMVGKVDSCCLLSLPSKALTRLSTETLQPACMCPFQVVPEDLALGPWEITTVLQPLYSLVPAHHTMPPQGGLTSVKLTMYTSSSTGSPLVIMSRQRPLLLDN